MIILRCTNNEGLVTDLQPQDNIDLRLDISAIENTEIGTSFGISSQEFAIPGDNVANQFFGNLYNLGATPAVALQNSVECQVLTDGQEVFSGKLYIRNILTDQQGYTVYNVVVVNETIDFKYRLQNLALNDPKFDWSAYDHTLIAANVTGSWTGNLKSGSIVYPHVNYGQPDGDTGAPNYAFAGLNSAAALENTIDNITTPLRLFDFKPAIKLKDVIDVIFAGTGESGSIGYQYTSSFFDSEYFNNLYLLSTADDTLGPTNTSPILQSSWAYRSGSTQTTIGTATTDIDFNAESYDNGGNYNLGTNRYVATNSGSYTFTAQLTYTLDNYVQNPNDSVSLRFTKNGSPVTESQVTTFNVYATTGSLLTQQTFDLVFGDSIGLQMFLSTNNVSNLIAHPGETKTFLQVTGPKTIVGGNVSMREQFPDDLKALDVIQALIEKFNLVVEPVVNQPNLLRIEPYDTWADNGKVVDWTNKVDRDTKFQISHPALEQPRTIIFSDEEDEDYLNKYTKQTFDKVYGQYIYTADSDLPQGERRIGKVFAATPTTNIPNSTAFIIPHLCTKNIGANETYKPIAFKPRLLYGIGTQSVESSAAGFSGSAALTSSYFLRTETGVPSRQTIWYQMSSLSEMPISGAAFDLHFNNNNQGKGAVPPYWSNVVPNGANFITGSGDAFTTYWANYINGLYDIDARKLVCNIYLKPTEIQDIALNDKIFIDGQYYRINKINGANLSKRDTVEVELIRTLARKLTFPRRRVTTTTGATRDIIWDGYNQGGGGNYVGFDDGVVVNDIKALQEAGQLDGYRVYESGSGTGSVVWNFSDPVVPALQQNVIGTNDVAVDSSKISVLGSKNTVGTSVSTVTALGQYNTVQQNVTNAFVLGQENTIGEQAVNSHIIGGLGNFTSGSIIGTTIIGGSGSYAVNSDYSMIINGEAAAVRDSDYTTLINGHTNEVVINGSGHTVIGLNLEGGGLDLLNTRNNSNWLGDTYVGEGLLVNSYTLNVGDGTNIFLTGSNQGQGKHETLYILNWNGLSPGTASINLPSAANNDYKGVVYTFKLASGNAGEIVRLVPFTGTQTIDGATSYSTSGSYAFVSIHASGSKWHIIDSSTGTGGGSTPITSGSFTGSFSGSFTGSFSGSITSASYALTASCADNIKVTNIDQPDPVIYYYTQVESTGSGCQALETLDTTGLRYNGSTNTHLLNSNLTITGSVNATSFTGSLLGTASFAISSSRAAVANAVDVITVAGQVPILLGETGIIQSTRVAIDDADFFYNTTTNRLNAPNITATTLTGSLSGSVNGTASFATSASHAISSSVAASSSFSFIDYNLLNSFPSMSLVLVEANPSGSAADSFRLLEAMAPQGGRFLGLDAQTSYQGLTIRTSQASSPGIVLSASFKQPAFGFDGGPTTFEAPNITGSLLGTASYALVSEIVTSSSFATSASFASNAPNIYNTNSTLTDNRTVNLGGNNLTFLANGGETFKISSSVSSDVLITGLPQVSGSNVLYYNVATGQVTYGPALSGSITSSNDSPISTFSALQSNAQSVYTQQLFLTASVTSSIHISASGVHQIIAPATTGTGSVNLYFYPDIINTGDVCAAYFLIPSGSGVAVRWRSLISSSAAAGYYHQQSSAIGSVTNQISRQTSLDTRNWNTATNNPTIMTKAADGTVYLGGAGSYNPIPPNTFGFTGNQGTPI